MDWKQIARDHWRSGKYEITKIRDRWCLWKSGKFVTHSDDLDKRYFSMLDLDRLKCFAADCEVHELV